MSNDNISQVRDALLAKPEEKAPKHLDDVWMQDQENQLRHLVPVHIQRPRGFRV